MEKATTDRTLKSLARSDHDDGRTDRPSGSDGVSSEREPAA